MRGCCGSLLVLVPLVPVLMLLLSARGDGSSSQPFPGLVPRSRVRKREALWHIRCGWLRWLSGDRPFRRLAPDGKAVRGTSRGRDGRNLRYSDSGQELCGPCAVRRGYVCAAVRVPSGLFAYEHGLGMVFFDMLRLSSGTRRFSQRGRVRRQ
ncbi:MAG: hypothetical protein A4E57_02062 [Syntrophorhabdaceae bacterium PtaU1.Bin034]|nr:MAG: hypothetical protein A4E57_02062 [Syntrophorhabdaceae bacterium PtaU1.Bin034]